MPSPDLSQIPFGVDPSDYLQAMRDSAVSDAALQSALTPPSVQNYGRQATRMSPLQPLIKVLTAGLARKSLDRSTEDQRQMFAQRLAMFNPGSQGQSYSQTTEDPAQSPPPSGVSGGGQMPPLAPQYVAGTPQQQNVTTPGTSNPLNPLRLPPGLMARMNPADLTKMLAGSPEYQDLVRAFGSPEAAAAAVRGKAHAAAMQTVRPSNTAIDLMSGTGMVAPDPERGLQFSGDPTRGPISAATIPGVAENAGRNAFFTSQGTHLGTPEYKPAGPGGTPTPMYPPPNPNAPPAVGAPGAAPAAAPALPPVGAGAAGQGSYFGPHASPTSLTEEQRLKQGTDAGVAYQSELSKNASGALGVVRSVSEMRNLLKASGDPNATTPVRAQMGAYAIAAGMDPDTVQKFFNVDPGAIEAATKQTSTLAVAKIHSMTSRGTNFDLATFMRNNPNAGMTPEGFSRVSEYMEKEARDAIGQQQDFEQWKVGKPAYDWEGGHTAHWNQAMLDKISKGQTNSRRPLSQIIPVPGQQ